MSARTFLAVALLAALAACKLELVCDEDETACGRTCKALATDPQNCGACGNVCAQGETCSGGHCLCASSLDGKRVDCDGACVDLASDPGNCGSCGATCDGSQVCTTAGGATRCADACADAGQTACDRACVDLASDAWNCGACGRACGTGEHCRSGGCIADLYAACFASGEVREATGALEPAGVPIPVGGGPVPLAWVQGVLYAASSQPGSAEAISGIRFDPPGIRSSVVWDSVVSMPDIEDMAERGGLLYVVHTSIGSLLVLAPSGEIVTQYDFAGEHQPNPNPNSIAFYGSVAYVSLNASDEIAVLDVSALDQGCTGGGCIRELGRIDVAPLASPGALAKPGRVITVGARVVVGLWNLDAGFKVVDGSTGRLAVIDAGTNALDPSVVSGGTPGLVDLGASCLDVAGLALSGSTLYVSCGAFQWPNTVGVGIVPVDLSSTPPSVGDILSVPAGDIPAAPGALAFCAGSGYVGDRNSGRVFPLSMSGDQVQSVGEGVVLCPASGGWAYVADIACGF